MAAKTPLYTPDISLAEYQRRLEDYRISIDQNKYDVILNFINDLLDLEDNVKYKNLRNIRLNISNLENKKEHITDTVLKYQEELENTFNITVNPDKKNIKYALYILSKILKVLDYKMIKMKEYYLIKN
jgi:molecular chaperone GrpE (heat shock protein)